MDTSNSQTGLHVRVVELRRSPHPENRVLANKCGAVLSQILKDLTPVLRYVCVNRNFGRRASDQVRVRCLPIGKLEKGQRQPTSDYVDDGSEEWCAPREVFITEEGRFFSVGEDGQIMHNFGEGVAETLFRGNHDWEFIMFDEMIAILQKAFQDATKKKEKHFKALRKRTAMLDKVAAAIRS